MKIKRVLAVLLAGALALSAMAGCGDSTSSSGSSGSSGSTGSSGDGKSDAKLTIWVYGWEKASADKIKEDTAAYKEQTGVEVTTVPIASDSYNTKIQATLAGVTLRTLLSVMPVCRARSWQLKASCWA